MTMGIAGGVARRSSNASAGAAIVGLVLGFAVAASLGLFLVSNFFKKFDPQSGDLVLPLLTHGAIWSAVGAIGGLAFGLGLGGKGRWTATLGGGLLGAAAAAVIYEIVGARLRVEQDRSTRVGHAREPRHGPFSGSDPVRDGRGPGPPPISEETGLLVRPLMKSGRPAHSDRLQKEGRSPSLRGPPSRATAGDRDRSGRNFDLNSCRS